MEIADILVVNKSDLPNADLLARQLASIVEGARTGRKTPIVRTASARDEGIDELVAALDDHRAYIAEPSVRQEHCTTRARHQVVALARQRLIDRVVELHGADGRLEELVEAVADRRMDPHTAADALIGE